MTAIVLFVLFGIMFSGLAILTFVWPRHMIKLIDGVERKWAVDKELFMKSSLARISIGATFLVAGVVLFYAAYVMSK